MRILFYMCDTFVFVPAKTGGPVVFGKNSDREPNEAQQIVRYPAHARDDGRLKATYIEIEVDVPVREVILSKPFQMWGAEMGVNDRSVAIGNEAVFTKVPFRKNNSGLTGMDLVRLGLEYGTSADSAMQVIISFLEKYGQDACGGYRDTGFYYHNSFIIADPGSAFVLETAGRHWAWQAVDGYRAISNGLTIEDDYDEISAGAREFASKKGWANGSGKFRFGNSYSSSLMPRLARCSARRTLSEQEGRKAGYLSPIDAFSILRTHSRVNHHPKRARPNDLCMHASGLMCPHQTTGSMVAELRPGGPPTVWLTGSSAPCLSLFKPFYFGTDVLEEWRFTPPGPTASNAYWWKSEIFHRRALSHYSSIIEEVRADQAAQESKWADIDSSLEVGDLNGRSEFSTECLRDAGAILESWISSLELYDRDRLPLLYKWWWRPRNRRAGIEL